MTIPTELFDEVYSIQTKGDNCRIDSSMKCHAICEPGPSNPHGENIILLPGEWEYIKSRLGEDPKFYRADYKESSLSFVLPDNICPYFENQCTIFNHRPIRCRSYPVLVTKLDPNGLRVWSAQQCPRSVRHIDRLQDDDHYNVWIAAWDSLMSYLDADWCRKYAQMLPKGCKHLADILQPKQMHDATTLPFSTAYALANSSCSLCHGKGLITVDSKEKFCVCVSKNLEKQKQKDVKLELKELE
jgi:hypothetical protein